MEEQIQAPLTVDETEGKLLSVIGDTYRLVATGKQTNGAYAAIDMLIPPNGGPGPHAHPNFQESFYVLDGEIEVTSEAGKYIAKKGSFVNIPMGGIVHSFKNKSDTLAHLMCVVVPAGLEEFFEEIGQPVALGEFLLPPEMDEETAKKLTDIATRYGQTIYPPDYFTKQ